MRSWKTLILALLTVSAVTGLQQRTAAVQSPAAPGGPANRLIVYGDTAMFTPPGTPENCILRSRFKRGDPVGWRMFVADPQTGNREESAQLVVHLTVAGKTQDIPMRYRATAAQPERQYTAQDHAGHWWTFSQHIADLAPEDWGAVSAGT